MTFLKNSRYMRIIQKQKMGKALHDREQQDLKKLLDLKELESFYQNFDQVKEVCLDGFEDAPQRRQQMLWN